MNEFDLIMIKIILWIRFLSLGFLLSIFIIGFFWTYSTIVYGIYNYNYSLSCLMLTILGFIVFYFTRLEYFKIKLVEKYGEKFLEDMKS